jgi:HEAT repeat protein
MKIIKTIIIALALTLGAASTASAEYLPSNATQADQVDSLDLMVRFLSEDAYIPSRLELRHVSPDVVADLTEIATGRYKTKVRNRAVQSLALYRSDERAYGVLEAMLEQLSPGDALFPGVIVAYAQMAGEESFEKIAEFATHSRIDVRMAAVVALGRFGGTAGFEHLNEIASAEENPVIRQRIESYIQ